MPDRAAAKPRVLVIDDEPFYAQFISDVLIDRGGFDVTQAHSADDAINFIRKRGFQLYVVDLKMPASKSLEEAGAASGTKTGLLLIREIRQRWPDAKIIAHTIIPDPEAQQRLSQFEGVAFLYKTPDADQFLSVVRRLLSPGKDWPRTFIVHGRDRASVLELKQFLQNRLRFKEPIVLDEQKADGRTIIEKFEHYAAKADVVFVLLTPDDMGHLKRSPKLGQPRPRLNVVFELGYFLGVLRRHSGRVLVLHKGPIEIPSDVAGMAFIDISKGVEVAGERIRIELGDWLPGGNPG